MAYTQEQIDAAVTAEAKAWAEFFQVTDAAQIAARELMQRANVAVGYFDGGLAEFLPDSAPAALPMFAVSASIRGVPVMCGTIPAKSISAAIEIWRNEFADAPGKLRAELPTFKDAHRKLAERLLEAMDEHRALAAVHGVEFKARPSRAKVAA